MKRLKFNIFHSLVIYLIIIIFSSISIFNIFLFFIIESLFNLKRIDRRRYFKERYNIIQIIKNIKNYIANLHLEETNEFIISIATSAGEIATLETLFENNEENFLIFCTSITGRNKNLKLKNSKTLYLPVPCFLYIFIIFLIFKPKSIIFIEHEFWPQYFIASSLMKIPIISLQIRPTLFKNKFSTILYLNLLRLSNMIHLTESKEKYPSNFPFHKVVFENIDIKTLKEIKEEKINNPKISIIFASTHSKEEDIFYDSIKELKDKINCIFFIAPRHPQRTPEIMQKLKEKKLIPIKYSSIKEKLRFLLENLAETFERYNFDDYEIIKYCRFCLFIENEDKIDDNINGNLKNNIIVIDEFGVLDNIFKYSKVAIVGGSFAELGGGHNIYEPLLNCCNVIVGPYFYSMQNILQESIKLNIADISNASFKDLSQKIYNQWIISTQFENKKGNHKFYGSPFEKLYLSQINIKQHILDEILKVSRNS